jgi:acetylornithine deacetylase/succinyl-diaminopimelate desuccinylase-like protein
MRAHRTGASLAIAIGAFFSVGPARAQAQQNQLLRDIYKELIEINTTDSAGDNTRAANAMAERLRRAGYSDADVRVLVPPGAPTKGNVVARLRGSGARKPLLLVAHLDVVEATRRWHRRWLPT